VADCSVELVDEDLSAVPVLAEGTWDAKAFRVERLCRHAEVPRLIDVSHLPERPGERSDLLTALERIADENRCQRPGEKALVAALGVAGGRGDFLRARELAGRLEAEYPRSLRLRDALHELAWRAYRATRFDDAADYFNRSGDAYRAADLRADLGDLPGALALIEPHLGEANLAEFTVRKLLDRGDLETALRIAEPYVEKDRVAPLAVEAAVRLGREVPAAWRDKGAGTPAGRWYLAESAYRAFLSKPDAGALAALRETYAKIRTGGDWTSSVAAWWREATALERFDDHEAAERAFAACLELAHDMHVVSDAALGCRERRDDVTALLPIRGPPQPVDVDALRAKVEHSRWSSDFEMLGRRLLAANHVGEAALVLELASQEYPQPASARVALGFARLLLGDPQQARALYEQALHDDPRDTHAHANLAALLCRFGDVEGSRAELAKVTPSEALAGSDVDPLWERCRKGALSGTAR
jgi:tetratricopeptide (TPR) repeat protein